MNNNQLEKISNLGTINGIIYLNKLLGENYSYPKISFFASDYGIFPLEESHIVLLNSKIQLNETTITFFNNTKELSFDLRDSEWNKYFYGTKLGKINSLYYIEFFIDDYYMEIHFECPQV